jgi:hypothetical protein
MSAQGMRGEAWDYRTLKNVAQRVQSKGIDHRVPCDDSLVKSRLLIFESLPPPWE